MVQSAVLSHYERQARRLLSTAPDRLAVERTNPVTGGRWMNGADPIKEQIRVAARALKARDEFAKMAPTDAPALPLSYAEREKLKVGGLPHIVAWFARSLDGCNYDFGIHPVFEPYARGVLASSYTAYFVAEDKTLQQRFPARPLKGLGSGLYWRPSHAPIRSAPPWQQKIFLRNPPPPQSHGSHAVVGRPDANLPNGYAPKSTAFLQLDDEFLAHATKLAPCKRLPRSWEVYKPAEAFCHVAGCHKLWVRASDYGWLIERQEWLGGPEEVLAHLIWHFPLLCDTYASAARLAEAAHRGLPPEYLLKWISTT
jgi:hypothetical protein